MANPLPSAADIRVPPNNLEAERAVLGTFYFNSAAISDVRSILGPEDFYDPRHQIIYEAILALAGESKPIDPMVLINEVDRRGQLEKVGGAAYLTGLEQSVISPGNVMHHARIVLEKSRLRRLIRASSEISREAYAESLSAEQLLARSEQRIFEIMSARDSRQFYPLDEALARVRDQVVERSEKRHEVVGLATGFAQLDNLIGGLQKPDLLILAARPSVGKTSLALNIAANAAKLLRDRSGSDGRRAGIAIFSLEMSVEQVVQRLVCTEAHIPMALVRKNMLTTRQVEEFAATSQQMADLPLFVNDTPALDPADLRLKVQHLKMRCPDLALVIVDYLQLMSIRGMRQDNRQQEVATISRSLKALASDFQVPVLALSQLSRGIESRRGAEREPRLSDLRESGAIEQDADVVMFIHRTDRVIPDPGERPRKPTVSKVKLIVAKQRNGPVGHVDMLLVEDITRFGELEQGQG